MFSSYYKSFSWPIGSDNLLHKICCLSLKIKLLPVTVKDKHSCILGVIILLCNNPVTLLIRASEKRGIGDDSKMFFLISQ